MEGNKEKISVIEIDGDHYTRMGIQPIDYIHANSLDFIRGNIIKYATRDKYKNKDRDMLKCLHYCILSLVKDYGYNEEQIGKELFSTKK